MSWGSIGQIDAKAMFLTLILFASSVISAYCLAGLLRPGQLSGFVRRTAIVLALVCGIYSADSFFLLGFRAPDMVRLENDFGIPRVAGPLFASSTGYFLIVPALAYLVEDMLRGKGRRSVSIVCIVLLGITLFALGSRGGILVIVCFLALCLVFVREISKKVLACAVTTAVMLLAAALVLEKGEITRVESFEDQARDSYHREAWNRMKDRDLAENIFGSGYGSIWPWYRLDEFIVLKMFDMSVSTRDGWMVAGRYQYHPHSVLLLLGVELGLAGLLYCIYLFAVFWRILVWQRLSRGQVIWACGLMASAVALLLDLFLFYRPRMAVVWWVWLFAAIRSSEYALAREQVLRDAKADWDQAIAEPMAVAP